MRRLIVRGLTRLAASVRQELSHPIAPARLAAVRTQVEDTVADLGRMLAQEGLTSQAMPPPTRRAYLFLAGLDWQAVNVSLHETARPAPPAGSVHFPRVEALIKKWAGLLSTAPPEEVEALTGRLTTLHRDIEALCATLQPHQLREKSRLLRAWLGFFARPGNIELYRRSAALAREAMETAGRRHGRAFSPPAVIRFLNQATLYRVRFPRGRMEIDLAGPMMCLSAAEWADLAERIFAATAGMSVHLERIVQRDDYQALLADLYGRTGQAEHARGLHHDLGASFDRVNAEYFGGRLARPRLTWSTRFTRRKLGHYSRSHDTVMISSSLDQPSVPSCAVDFVMYHELLHKAQDIAGASRSRRSVHNSQFERDEKRFRQYDQARAAIAKLK